MGTFMGDPIFRLILDWGLYWGPLILGNYQISIVDCGNLAPPCMPCILDEQRITDLKWRKISSIHRRTPI